MSDSQATIRTATWAEDGEVIQSVRSDVFVREQAIPAELDFDGADPVCLHVLAFVGDEAIGTGRMAPDGHIGRVAVLKNWRRQRVGSALVDLLVSMARDRGLKTVYLNSQRSAAGFYEALGFAEAGDTFFEAGIEHVRMESSSALPCS